MDRRLLLIVACLVAGGSHPRLAADDLPPGASLRLGDARFLAGGAVERLEFSADARTLTAWTAPAGPRDSRWKTAWDSVAWQPVRTADDVQLAGAVVRFQPTSIPNTTHGVVVGPDGGAVVRDFATGNDVVRLNGHHSRVTAVAVSPDGKRIATASADGLVRVWDAETFRPITSPKGHTAAVRRVEVSADGRTALTAAPDGTVRLWDLGTGRELRAFAATDCAAAFTADGAAVRLRDGERIATRDLVTGLEVVSKVEPRGDPFLMSRWLLGQLGKCVAVSPDGRTLVVGRRSGEVQLYETVTGQPRRWLGHAGGCFDLAFTPDGRRLLTAGGDHSALVWGVRVQDVPLPEALKRETSAARLWEWMTDGNAGLAYAAMARLATDPAATVRMARLRLRPGLLAEPVAEVRAVELLEAIETAEARTLLKELAAGDPGATRTREARAAGQRLKGR
jgi:WD40 repeat protein